MYNCLTCDELKEIETICNKWLCPKDDNLKPKKLNILYDSLKTTDFTPVVKAFTDRLRTIPWKFSKSEEVSGSICFFGGVMTSVLNYGYIEEIEGLFTFAVCYMLIDHFLDNSEINDVDKIKCIKEIYSFIVSGEKNNNLMVTAVGDRYLDLIKRVPKSREYFIKLFQSELKGVVVQKSTNLSREEYLKAAEEKGGMTSLCIASIINLEIEENGNYENDDSYRYGKITQFVDDLLDIKDDKAEGIYTLARYDLKNGNMNKYIYETIKDIDKLSPVYNVFKIILLSGIILGVHDNPGSVSDSLTSIIQKYNIYEETSKEKLIEWFHQKLENYIKENDL